VRRKHPKIGTPTLDRRLQTVAGMDVATTDCEWLLRGVPVSATLTEESVSVADVDARNQGRVFLQGIPTPGGRAVIHFDLRSLSLEPIAGTAALYVELEDNTAQLRRQPKPQDRDLAVVSR
jgi:hypothetical protein